MLTLLDVCLKIYFDPYESKDGGFLEKYNDSILLFTTYFNFGFTDYAPSPEAKCAFGWIYNGLVVLILVPNLGFLLYTSFI